MSTHRWGDSPAADRVWAQVSGLPPSKAGSRKLMVWQAYVDESAGEDGLFVLAGYIASAENWAKFSAEWEAMLPYTRVQWSKTRRRFKMSEMAESEEFLNRSVAFYRIIERHVEMAFSMVLNVNDLHEAKKFVHVHDPDLIPWEIEGEPIDNPYLFGFKALVELMKAAGFGIIKNGKPLIFDKINLIFDDRAEKGFILKQWDEFVVNFGKGFLGATPRFESDDEFLPLQAADFIAWWYRKWYHDANFDPGNLPFGSFYQNRVMPSFCWEYNRDDMIDVIIDLYRQTKRDDLTVIDLRTGIHTTQVDPSRAWTITPAPPLKRR